MRILSSFIWSDPLVDVHVLTPHSSSSDVTLLLITTVSSATVAMGLGSTVTPVSLPKKYESGPPFLTVTT
jgi:hypothetical protein